jgi:hypothetical protein
MLDPPWNLKKIRILSIVLIDNVRLFRAITRWHDTSVSLALFTLFGVFAVVAIKFVACVAAVI